MSEFEQILSKGRESFISNFVLAKEEAAAFIFREAYDLNKSNPLYHVLRAIVEEAQG